jgi:tetratricopeptide (TPR) repeat protein
VSARRGGGGRLTPLALAGLLACASGGAQEPSSLLQQAAMSTGQAAALATDDLGGMRIAPSSEKYTAPPSALLNASVSAPLITPLIAPMSAPLIAPLSTQPVLRPVVKTVSSQAAPARPAAIAPVPGLAVDDLPPRQTLLQIVATLRAIPGKGADTEALARATAALGFAAELDLGKASKAINEALQLDARNSYLHFFNGFIYHLQARQGDTDKTELALEGYQQAVRFEPSNWIAHEFLGLALLEQKLYRKAQSAFAEVLLQRPDDPVVLARMLAASYLAGDARTACAMADQLNGMADVGGSRPSFLRTSVSVYAACGEFDKAESARLAYEGLAKNPAEAQQAGRRLSQWQSFFKSQGEAGDGLAAGMIKTQGQPQQMGGPPLPSPVPATAPSTGDSRMVLVDVVMVRTEDSISSSKGVNLLSALQLQFGSVSEAAFSKTFSQSTAAGGSTILARAITVPALAYSLNVANANSSLNEVLARPTLAAVEGMRSEFFSGTSLNAAVVSNGGVSGGGGSAVSLEKRYGVKLTVLPQIMANGMIRLSIDASRTFLKPPSANIGFTYKLEISEILANANVVMRMGDTLVLGGLSEKESTTNRDGVPLLQDVPGLQYLFSQQNKTDYQRSVLILITPRPASYTWLSEEAQSAIAKDSAKDGGVSPGLDVLRARYSDWFKPYPNLASVFHHLNYADLYREFRTGDVTLERWDRMDTTAERLRQALSFLYY